MDDLLKKYRLFSRFFFSRDLSRLDDRRNDSTALESSHLCTSLGFLGSTPWEIVQPKPIMGAWFGYGSASWFMSLVHVNILCPTRGFHASFVLFDAVIISRFSSVFSQGVHSFFQLLFLNPYIAVFQFLHSISFLPFLSSSLTHRILT